MRKAAVIIIVLLSVVASFALFHSDGGKDLHDVRARYECLEEVAERVSGEAKLPVIPLGMRFRDLPALIYMFAPCYVTDTPDAAARFSLVVCRPHLSDSVYGSIRNRVEWLSRDCEYHYFLLNNRR